MTKSGIYTEIAGKKPDFFLNLGDIHYSGSNRSSREDFLFAYHELFKSAEQRAFYENHALVYTWDDHDVGDNNADGLS